MVTPATADTVYEPVIGWPRIPHPMSFHEATSVAVDSQDRVYVFNRGAWPMMVFDREGQFINTWGSADEFGRPHSVTVDSEGNLYLTDGNHTVHKRTQTGEPIFILGERDKPAPAHCGRPFNSPTDVAIHPATGDLFVSDGYHNSAVHRFDPNGRHIMSWGEPGTEPGQFSLPHNLCMLGDDRVLVCDRENFRLQVFTTDGEFMSQVICHRAQAATAGKGEDTNIYVAQGRPPVLMEGVPRLGRRVVIYNRDLQQILQIGNDMGGEGPDQFISPHSIAVDSEGSIYVAEVSYTAHGSRLDPPREVISLRKWRRVQG